MSNALGDLLGIEWIHHIGVLSMSEDFGRSTMVRNNCGRAMIQGLQRHQAERFIKWNIDDKTRVRLEFRQLLITELPQKTYVVL